MDNGIDYILSTLDNIVVDVKKFGAKCNGIDDDTQAYQDALNYCKGRGGGLVLIPVGTSIVSSLKLSSYCGLVGSGRRSILKQKSNSVAPVISLQNDSTNFTFIRDFSIQGNKANQTSQEAKGISYINSEQFTSSDPQFGEWDSRHVALNIYIKDTKGVGLETSGRGESHFTNIQVVGSDDYGMKLNAFDNFYDGLSSGANAKTGLYITMGSRYVNCKSWNNGNTTDDSDGYGWYVNASSVSFVCCEAQGNYNDGFYFDNCSNCIGCGLVSDVNGQHENVKYKGRGGYHLNNSSINTIQGISRNIDTNIAQDYGVLMSGWSTDNVIDILCNNIPVMPFYMIDNSGNEYRNYIRVTNGVSNQNVISIGKFGYMGVNAKPNKSLASVVAKGNYNTNMLAGFFQQTMDRTGYNNIVSFQATDKDNESNNINLNIGAYIDKNIVKLATSNNAWLEWDATMKITGGTWDLPHISLGDQHLFFDSTGKLRIKYQDPTSDKDGKEVVVLEEGVVNSFNNLKASAIGIGASPNATISPLWVYNNSENLAALLQSGIQNTSVGNNINLLRLEGINKDNTSSRVNLNIGVNIANNELYLDTNGSNLRVDDNLKLRNGDWQYSHLIMGDQHIWIDSNGKLRIKNGAPISDKDGKEVLVLNDSGTNLFNNLKVSAIGVGTDPNTTVSPFLLYNNSENLAALLQSGIQNASTTNNINVLRVEAVNKDNTSSKVNLNIGANIANNEMYLDTNGGNLRVDDNLKLRNGDWQFSHLIMGNQHIWIDSSGKLRIKDGAPASDKDGKEVVVLADGVMNSFNNLKSSAIGIGTDPNATVSPLWVYNNSENLSALLQSGIQNASAGNNVNVLRVEAINKDNTSSKVNLNIGANIANNEIYLDTSGNNLRVDDNLKLRNGDWQYSHLIMGNQHIWIDSSGKLRVKDGAPTSDKDGKEVVVLANGVVNTFNGLKASTVGIGIDPNAAVTPVWIYNNSENLAALLQSAIQNASAGNNINILRLEGVNKDNTSSKVNLNIGANITNNEVYLDTSGNSIRVDDNLKLRNGDWQFSHLIMGNQHIWIDSSGKMRLKDGAPTSDKDGKEVLVLANGVVNSFNGLKASTVGIGTDPNAAVTPVWIYNNSENLAVLLQSAIQNASAGNNINILRLEGVNKDNTSSKVNLNIGANITNNEVYLDTSGNNIRVDDNLKLRNGDWQFSHLIMGNQHIWIDANGKMRIKDGAPTSDKDGKEVVVLADGVVNSFNNLKSSAIGIGTDPNATVAPVWIYNNSENLAALLQCGIQNASVSNNINVLRIEVVNKDNSSSKVNLNIGANITDNEIYLDTSGNNIRIEDNLKFRYGNWQFSHLIMGNYHIWVDNSGRMKIKDGAPTSSSDGNYMPRIVSTPASSTSEGTAYDVAIDNNYIYVCVGTNSWKRVPLQSW
ncbi:hypothetical protein [Clostridium sp. C8-1-8]|uniref:hypothetical protein n=1 Tax=Clostridium sp. C8-1-8 TaxID=2698831 RepID=UPI001369EF0B|nr:hypothetical protein [Clostridium sp. C8-1-8]